MWRRWTCRRLQARLVDLAAGTLDTTDRPRVVAHLARCRECAAAATALREVPALLRDAAGAPDETFWRAQCDAVMRQVRALPAPALRPRRGRAWEAVAAARRLVRWTPALAAAAAAGIVLALRMPAPRPPEPDVPAATVETLDDPVLLSLRELTGGSRADVRPVSDAANHGWLSELSDEELHVMVELVGARER